MLDLSNENFPREKIFSWIKGTPVISVIAEEMHWDVCTAEKIQSRRVDVDLPIDVQGVCYLHWNVAHLTVVRDECKGVVLAAETAGREEIERALRGVHRCQAQQYS
jgi:hypothetical protein